MFIYKQLSGREIGRISDHKGALYSKALSVLQFTLPGSMAVYYGDEIGMTKTYIDYRDTLDIRALHRGSVRYAFKDNRYMCLCATRMRCLFKSRAKLVNKQYECLWLIPLRQSFRLSLNH